MEQPLFNSTHEALLFAYNYSYQQSPKSTMTALMARKDEENGAVRTEGRGLSGVDGAAQAGMVLAQVERLPASQRNYIVAKYGDATHECLCCGEDAHTREWKAAIDALSGCIELDGLPKKVKLSLIRKAICGSKFDQGKMVDKYDLSERTVYRKTADVQARMDKIRKDAYKMLNDAFYQDKRLIA